LVSVQPFAVLVNSNESIFMESLILFYGKCAICLRLMAAADTYGHCRMLGLYMALYLAMPYFLRYILFCFNLVEIEISQLNLQPYGITRHAPGPVKPAVAMALTPFIVHAVMLPSTCRQIRSDLPSPFKSLM
jgi:hypothetical protein